MAIVEGKVCFRGLGDLIVLTSRSGKSTLVASLLRLLDHDKGTISIDGLEITSIKRNDVRSRLIVLPQDPLLLQASLRENMELCVTASDDAIWESLRATGIDTMVRQKGGLDAVVSQNTMSDGELRLVCIARLLLKDSQVLILDEPTSRYVGGEASMNEKFAKTKFCRSLDLDIQSTVLSEIWKKFEKSTILCIAHRLDTILDFDVVLVMEQGAVIETGRPRELLRTPGSAFAALYQKSK